MPRKKVQIKIVFGSTVFGMMMLRLPLLLLQYTYDEIKIERKFTTLVTLILK